LEDNELGIKAIFFDLDDTLHDHLFPFSNAFKTTFPDYYEQINIESVYKSFRDFSDLLWKNYSNNELTLQELRMNRIALAMKGFTIHISNESASEFQTQYESGLKHLRLFPEVPELLVMIKNKGYEIGMITNGPVDHQLNKINSLGLTEFIPREMIFISDEVGIAKPNPGIFHHAGDKFNFAPKEFLYIGDSWHNDVVAPTEAGWRTIWFNHRKRQPGTDHRPVAEIDQLSNFLSVLSKIED
jgi:HAD superfamily hydrolase (TIGR01549 family)